MQAATSRVGWLCTLHWSDLCNDYNLIPSNSSRLSEAIGTSCFTSPRLLLLLRHSALAMLGLSLASRSLSCRRLRTHPIPLPSSSSPPTTSDIPTPPFLSLTAPSRPPPTTTFWA